MRVYMASELCFVFATDVSGWYFDPFRISNAHNWPMWLKLAFNMQIFQISAPTLSFFAHDADAGDRILVYAASPLLCGRLIFTLFSERRDLRQGPIRFSFAIFHIDNFPHRFSEIIVQPVLGQFHVVFDQNAWVVSIRSLFCSRSHRS